MEHQVYFADTKPRVKTHLRHSSKGGSGDWSNLAERRYLANVSSELFSTSGLFLGLNINMTSDPYTAMNGSSYGDYQGKVSVPPGQQLRNAEGYEFISVIFTFSLVLPHVCQVKCCLSSTINVAWCVGTWYRELSAV